VTDDSPVNNSDLCRGLTHTHSCVHQIRLPSKMTVGLPVYFVSAFEVYSRIIGAIYIVIYNNFHFISFHLLPEYNLSV